MNKTYFTADLHVGHANVLVYDKRPFRDLSHMHEVLINNYNSTVGPDDTCFFLGDIGLGKAGVLGKVVARLHGTKVLILGNHDKNASAMLRLGFDAVLNSASLVIAGQLVTMSHCPLRGIFREDVSGMRGAAEGDHWHGESRHAHFSLPDFGQFHIHGHIHSGPANDKPKSTHNQFDVGVAANNYRPVSMSQLESWIMTERKRNA